MKKNIFIPTVAILFMMSVSGCGGASGSSTPSYKNTIPADPGALATSTIFGVDENKNGVRDEVEIAIAKMVGSESSFTMTLELAALLQLQLRSEAVLQSDAQILARKIYCAEQNRGEAARKEMPLDILRALTYDTQERQVLFDKYILAYGVTINFDGDLTCV